MKLNDSTNGESENGLADLVLGVGIGAAIVLGGAAMADSLDIFGHDTFSAPAGESTWDDYVHHQIRNGLEV